MDFGAASAPLEENLHTLPETTWIQPVPTGALLLEGDPADVTVSGGQIAQLTFFLDTDTLFPLFGLPPHLDG
jgi:hypothetical protein